MLKYFLNKKRKVDEAEVFVISYPKSGRTWLRALVGKYYSLKNGLSDENLFAINEIVQKNNLPSISFTHDMSGMTSGLDYNDLGFSKNKYSKSKVLFLGRSFKDTLVSAYFQASKRKKIYDGEISDFVRSDLYGIEKLARFYHVWKKHVKTPKSFMYIEYEDMHQSPEDVLQHVLMYFGEEEIDVELIKESVAYCAFENLKRMEKNEKFAGSILRAVDKSDDETYKVRKGKVGGYKEYLTAADERYIDSVIKKYDIDFSDYKPK